MPPPPFSAPSFASFLPSFFEARYAAAPATTATRTGLDLAADTLRMRKKRDGLAWSEPIGVEKKKLSLSRCGLRVVPGACHSGLTRSSQHAGAVSSCFNEAVFSVVGLCRFSPFELLLLLR